MKKKPRIEEGKEKNRTVREIQFWSGHLMWFFKTPPKKINKKKKRKIINLPKAIRIIQNRW